MQQYTLVITGPIGAGKSSICNLLHSTFDSDYIKEYIDMAGGERMLEKWIKHEIEDSEFQDYILNCTKLQLECAKRPIRIIERLPNECYYIFSPENHDLLQKATKLQRMFHIDKFNENNLTVIENTGQTVDYLAEMIKEICLKDINDNVDSRIVYLRTPVRLSGLRIKLRGRVSEKYYSGDYLQTIYDRYEKLYNRH